MPHQPDSTQMSILPSAQPQWLPLPPRQIPPTLLDLLEGCEPRESESEEDSLPLLQITRFNFKSPRISKYFKILSHIIDQSSGNELVTLNTQYC